MAKDITGAASDITNSINTVRQNNQANQLSSQMDNSGNYAPRAALVSPGSNPITGAINSLRPGMNTQGSAPVTDTGGVPGLELRMAIQKAQRESTGADVENRLKEAEAGYYGAHSQYLQQQPGLQRREQNLLYRQQRDAQTDQEKNADTIPRLSKDIDDSYGPGTFQKFTTALSQDPTGSSLRGSINTTDGKQYWIPSPNGPLFSPEAPKPNPGFWGLGAGPGEMSGEVTMPASAFQGYLSRYQKIQSSPTGRYVPPAATPGPNASPLPGGAGAGGPQIQTIADPNVAAKLPPGTLFRTPQGVIKRVPYSGAPTQGAIPAVTPAPNG